MKKALMAICVALACTAVTAQETAPAAEPAAPKTVSAKATWPVWLAFNSTDDADIIGLRLTLFYGKCESVTGFDVGFYGIARNMEGFQVNLLRNEAEDGFAGVQGGIYNTIGSAEHGGAQLGLFNEARSFLGAQVGIFNVATQVEGLQLGLVNRAETVHGVQIGLVNVIRDSEIAFCPIVNIGFDVFPNY